MALKIDYDNLRHSLTPFDKELLIDMYVELFKRFKEYVDGHSKES